MAAMAADVLDSIELELAINDRTYRVTVAPMESLLSVLRDRLRLTGTKEGCAIGVCGLCTVLVDGQPTAACLLPAVHVPGHRVTTIEGLRRPDGALTPLQESFIARGGLQCGICTPGQLLTATALLASVPQPSEADVLAWLGGNLCRCTGYYGIVDAVLAAAGSDGPASIRPPVRVIEAPASGAGGTVDDPPSS